MKTKIIIVAIILFSSLLISCSRTTIESIQVSFYHTLFQAILPTDCNDIKNGISPSKALLMITQDPIGYSLNDKNGGVLDTIIVNPIVLVEIEKELKNLKSKPVNNPIDARISCTIKYKNGKEEKLCIGGYLVESLEYCGIRQNNNYHLLYLIKQNIGFYSWMDDRYLEYCDELQDISFKRDSIVGRSGRKF